MSARFVLSAAVGAAAGFIGGPMAGYQAFSITYGLSGFLDPSQKVHGPRLDDVKAPSAAYGAVIPYIEGHPRVSGSIVWCTDKREIPSTTSSSGKGGPGVDSTTYTYEVDCLILLAENPGFGVRRIWSNGALVWTAADDSDDDSIAASDVAASWREMRLYAGADDQLADPTYEAAVGAANASAYRGRSAVMFEGLNLGPSGQFPLLTFEIYGDGTIAATGFLEDFESDFPGEYTIIGSAIGLQPGPWGNCIAGEGGSITAFGSSAWRLVDTGGPITTAKFNFKLDDPFVYGGSGNNTDDSPILEVSDAAGDNLFSFAAAREWFYDIKQAPTIWFNDAPGIALATSDLAREVWYQCTLEIVALNTCHVQISVIQTGAVLIDLELPMAGASWTPAKLRIYDAWSYGGSRTKPGGSFDQIYLGVPAERVTLLEPTLEDVMTRQWQRAGLDAALLDASAGASISVRALAVTQVTSPRQIMDMLATTYMMEFVESGAGVKMVARGGAPALTLPWDELGTAAEGNDAGPLPLTRGNELETPAQWGIKFANVDDDYRDGNETSARLATGSSIVTVTELPLGLTATEAKRLAEILVTDAYASLIRVGPIKLTRAHDALEPTDVVLLTGSYGSTYRARLTKKTVSADGMLSFEALLDDATAVDSDAVTSGGYNSSTIVRAVSDTVFELLDIPILRDADDARGIYAAGRGRSTTWRGFGLYKSLDNYYFTLAISGTKPATMGYCSVAPGAWAGGRKLDETNTMTVVVGTDGTLESITRDALLGDPFANAFALGGPDRWILGQFRDAELVSTGTYKLSGFLWGARGTEWASGLQIAGDSFVLLKQDGSILRTPQVASDLGAVRYYRALSSGRRPSDELYVPFTDQEVGLKPLSPVDVRAARTSGDLTVTWQRRSRNAVRMIGDAGILVPLGEDTEAYSIDIFADGTYTDTLRTIAVGAPSATYTAAQQTTDFGSPQATVHLRIHQLSTATGRGYAATAAV